MGLGLEVEIGRGKMKRIRFFAAGKNRSEILCSADSSSLKLNSVGRDTCWSGLPTLHGLDLVA